MTLIIESFTFDFKVFPGKRKQPCNWVQGLTVLINPIYKLKHLAFIHPP